VSQPVDLNSFKYEVLLMSFSIVSKAKQRCSDENIENNVIRDALLYL